MASEQGMIYAVDLTVQCSYCLGMMPAGEAVCPRCGAPLEEITRIKDNSETDLQDLIEISNQRLVESGSSAAEIAFGVGCTLGFLVGGLIMVIIFFTITKTWTILAVILFILMLISFLISSVLANRARQATARTSYEREVNPEIEKYITEHGLSRDEFNDRAAGLLPEDSPLLSYLSPHGD